MSLTISITLSTAQHDSYSSSSRGNGIKGKLADAIATIATHVAITDYDADHNYNSNQTAHIVGTTTLTLTELTLALYGDDNVASRMRRLKTTADLLRLSSTPQAHVPTEDELEAGRVYGCDIHDKCTPAMHHTSYTCSNDPAVCDVPGCPVHG